MSAERDEMVISETLPFYGQTLDWLKSHHAQFAEKAELDLRADDRETAIWMLSGQSLALSTALVELLGLGYTSQTLPTMRAIHEANQLLSAVSDPEEETIARRWLADQEVKQAEARKAAQREAERISAQMEAAGLEPLAADPGELSRLIYGAMSKAAHHRRSFVAEAVDLDAKTMIYGDDPRLDQRIDYVIFAGALLHEVLLGVGDSLCVLWGRGAGFYETHLTPELRKFEAVLGALDVIDTARRLGL